MSLGLNQELSFGALAPEPVHKSAGLAFLLSLVIPGSGQLYCGKIPRGLTTLGFWITGAVLTFAGTANARGTGITMFFVLWVFSFLDAYFTATEINSGIDAQVDVQNPRVAVTLNLLTAGLGYFYLGERTKGIVLFLVTNVLKFVIGATAGYWSGVVSLAALMVAALMAADACRVARRGIAEALGPELQQPVTSTGKPSRLPIFVPVGLATLASASLLAMIVFGLAVGAARGPSRPTTLNSSGTRYHVQRRTSFVPSKTAGAADALLSAVQDVQKLEKKGELAGDDIAGLEHSVGIFNTALGSQNLNRADLTVAYYYRAEAHRLINVIREHQGLAIDFSMARHALEDFDEVIANKTSVYIPEVNVSNAEYWAGSVALHQLHSEPLAYSYWQKCAAQGHAGCVDLTTGAHLGAKTTHKSGHPQSDRASR